MRIIGILLISLFITVPCMAQKKDKNAKEFEGTVKYSISIEGLEGAEEALAMLPENMSEVYIKSRGGKSIFSVMGTTKMYYNKDNKDEMIIGFDFTMLGMGSFCIPTPFNNNADEPIKIVSSETKNILGYKAVKALLADSIEFWVSQDYYLNFPIQGMLYNLPLEFDIDNNGMRIHLIAKEISFNKPSKEEVEVPKDCNTTSMEEFQTIMEEMQEGLMPEEDLDLEEDE